MCGTIHLIIFAATAATLIKVGSIIMQTPPGVHWYMEKHNAPDMPEP